MLEQQADLHRGWRPRAEVQHLCTGSADTQVPAGISTAAAAAWDIPIITIQGKDHTEGIMSCIMVALGNLTSQAIMPTLKHANTTGADASALVVGEVDMSSSLLPFSRIAVSAWGLIFIVCIWLLIRSYQLVSVRLISRRQSTSTSISRCQAPPARCSIARPVLQALLTRPILIGALAFASIAVPTAIQLGIVTSRIIEGAPIFDLEIASLRTISGELTDRQDAFEMLNAQAKATTSSEAAALATQQQGRRLAQTRQVDIYYTSRGGRIVEGMSGNVISLSMLNRVRDTEASIVAPLLAEGKLVSMKSAVPCLFGDPLASDAGEAPLGDATINTVQSCLAHLMANPDELTDRFSADFSSFVAGSASCAALRSTLHIDVSADFDSWIHTLERLNDPFIEVSWWGESAVFWREFNLSLFHDVSFVVASMAFLLIFMTAVLRLPLFALLSLVVVVFSMFTALALFTGPLEQEKLPILAVVSIYLVLGVGVDAIFVFVNTYSAMHAEAEAELERMVEMERERHDAVSSSTIALSTAENLGPITIDASLASPSTKALSPSSFPSSAPSPTTSTRSATSPLSSPTATPELPRRNRLTTPKDSDSTSDAHISNTQRTLDEVNIAGRSIRHALTVTSLSMTTTAVAFGASVFTSSLSTIRQFALFQTLCVFIELVFVILLFIPLMFAWRTRLLRSHRGATGVTCTIISAPWLHRCCEPLSLARPVPRLFRCICFLLRVLQRPSTPEFWANVEPHLRRHRSRLLVAWAFILAIQAAFTTQLRPSAAAPKIFELDHNLQRRVHIRQYAFGDKSSTISEFSEAASRLQGSSQLSKWVGSADGQDCLSGDCPIDVLGDGVCQPQCNTAACCFDAGDCAACEGLEQALTSQGAVAGVSSTPTSSSSSGISDDSSGTSGSTSASVSSSSGTAPSNAPTASQTTITSARAHAATDLLSPPSFSSPRPPFAPPPTPPLPPLAPPSPPLLPSPPAVPSLIACTPTRPGELSFECSDHGGCEEPGYCACRAGYVGRQCEHTVDADGNELLLLPEHHCAVINFVWGMLPHTTRRLIDGVPLSASVDWEQPLLSEASQLLIVKLCEQLDSAPPWRVRAGSVICPLRDLRRARLSAGQSFPVPIAEVVHALRGLGEEKSEAWNSLIGVVPNATTEAPTVAWLTVSVRTNTLAEGSPKALLAEASWFEGLSTAHNAAAVASGSRLRGWQTSSAYVWMEALDEAVGGTVGSVISGALLTAATLLIFTGSLRLAGATICGVLCVLICFIGYLVERGYTLGVIEAIATTIFIGFSCDYCVHVLQVHRAGGGELKHTLALAGSSLYSAALTTAGAAAPLLLCRIVIFKQMGEFLIVCTVMSLAVALTLFAPLLSLAPCQAQATVE